MKAAIVGEFKREILVEVLGELGFTTLYFLPQYPSVTQLKGFNLLIMPLAFTAEEAEEIRRRIGGGGLAKSYIRGLKKKNPQLKIIVMVEELWMAMTAYSCDADYSLALAMSDKAIRSNLTYFFSPQYAIDCEQRSL